MAPEHEASTDAVTADSWRAVFDAAPVCSAVTRRRDGKILFVNPACLRMLGWTEAEVVGRTMIEVGFWTAEQRATMLERLDSAGVVRDLEQTITTPDGRTIVALMSISAVVLGGEPCLVGHIRDVTGARQLEDRLRESEERFRLLTENSTDVIARSCADWTIRYMSAACRALYGYEPEAMIGRSGWDFVTSSTPRTRRGWAASCRRTSAKPVTSSTATGSCVRARMPCGPASPRTSSSRA